MNNAIGHPSGQPADALQGAAASSAHHGLKPLRRLPGPAPAAPAPAAATTTYQGVQPTPGKAVPRIHLQAIDPAIATSAAVIHVLEQSPMSGDTIARDLANVVIHPDGPSVPTAIAEAGVTRADVGNLTPKAHAAILTNLWTGMVTGGESDTGIAFLQTLSKQGKLGPLIDELMAQGNFGDLLWNMESKIYDSGRLSTVSTLVDQCVPPPTTVRQALRVIDRTDNRLYTARNTSYSNRLNWDD